MLSTIIERLNDRRDAAGDAGEDAGFTLIELMVVLLILAILLAIAIPTFLGVTGGANDRAAQANLNTALTTAKGAGTENGQSYNTTGGGSTNINVTSLGSNEPSIKFVSGAVTGTGQVSVYFSSDGNGVVLASISKATNTCWFALDNLQPVSDTTGPYGAGAPTTAGTQYAHVTGTSSTPVVCDATDSATGASMPASTAWGAHF
jgi:type IV pilus assembly protein PilA